MTRKTDLEDAENIGKRMTINKVRRIFDEMVKEFRDKLKRLE